MLEKALARNRCPGEKGRSLWSVLILENWNDGPSVPPISAGVNTFFKEVVSDFGRLERVHAPWECALAVYA